MACSCRATAASVEAGEAGFTVVYPSGKTRTYASSAAANAAIMNTPGAYIKPAGTPAPTV